MMPGIPLLNVYCFLCWWLLFMQTVSAQTPVLNAEKYWLYRERLLEEFMVSSSGNEAGTHIPASIRHMGRGQMRWGDATINMSNFMAVLATEYSLLKGQGHPTENTLQELHRALLAMERLDAIAPEFFNMAASERPLDGFFIRDDVPVNFTEQWSDVNPAFADYPNVRSDFSNPDIRLNEMSQDQVWNLIVGLSLIGHLVDDTTLYGIPEYHGSMLLTIADRAMIAAYRMIAAMQAQVCVAPFRFMEGRLCVQYWHLMNPYLGQSVKRGSGPTLLKFGFAEAGNVITGYRFGDMHWGNSRHARIWFNIAGSLQYLQRLKRLKNIGNLYHIATTATVGSVWSTRDLVRLFNRHRKFLSPPDHQYEHLALISCVLHGDCPKILQKEQAFYEGLLNTAPRHGPFNYGVDYQPAQGSLVHYPYWEEYHFEWSSVNRFVWPHRRGEGTIEVHKGEYNGLDYMLLYNLYGLVFGYPNEP